MKVKVKAQGSDRHGRASTFGALLSGEKEVNSESMSWWVQVNVGDWSKVRQLKLQWLPVAGAD